MRVGSLCSGIGGFELAAEAMGWRTAWVSEIDPFCSAVLAHHFPDVPNLGDFTSYDWSTVERPDVVCAGWPCQPHSVAGKRGGSDDSRDLWPGVERCLRALRPRYFAGENVPGLLVSDGGRFFERVLCDLAALGYDAEWGLLSAAELGAPHKRERLWLVAHARRERDGSDQSVAERGGGGTADADTRGENVGDADGRRREQRDARDGPAAESCAGQPSVVDASSGGRGAGEGEPVRRTERGREAVGDADGAGLEQHGGPESVRAPLGSAQCRGGEVRDWSDAVALRGADGSVRLVPREAAEQGPQSPLWPVADGVPGRVARLRAVGNAAVPAWVVCGAFARVRAIEAAMSGR